MPTQAHIGETLDVRYYRQNPEFLAFLRQAALKAVEASDDARALAALAFGGVENGMVAFDGYMQSSANSARLSASDDDEEYDEDDEEYDEDEFDEDEYDEDEEEDFEDEEEDDEDFDDEEDDFEDDAEFEDVDLDELADFDDDDEEF
jgi:hypothetical protein